MKKEYLLIAFLSVFIGVFIGMQVKNRNSKIELSLIDKQIKSQIVNVEKENKDLSKKKDELTKQLQELEKDNMKDSKNKKMKEEIDNLKAILGYKAVEGDGLIITIDKKEDVNIAEKLEQKKLLLELVNELYVYGAEAISINDERVGPYSEIALAGQHININNIPIAQPYEIKVVGDQKNLKAHINDDSIIIDNMKSSYELAVDIKEEKDILIPQLDREKKFKYAKSV